MRSQLINKLAFEAIKSLGESTKREQCDYVLDRLVEMGEIAKFEPHQRPTYHKLISYGFETTALKEQNLVANERRGNNWIWFTTVATKMSSK